MARTKRTARAEADEICTLTRVVERNGVRFEVWTCSAPVSRTEAKPVRVRASDPAVYETIGGRTWRFFLVERACARRERTGITAPGWYCEIANGAPAPTLDGAIGPYATLDQAREDVQGWCAVE